MGGQEFSILFAGSAFLAGILSFLSPCVLPLVPVYLGYVTGSTPQDDTFSRQRTMAHALAFVAGFGTVFVLLGASVGLIGYWLIDRVPLFLRVGSVLVMLMGLHLIGVIRIPFLYAEKRLHVDPKDDPSVVSAAFIGVVFGAGWTPCVGPVLGAILSLAAVSGTALQGALLLAIYSAGLAIPFLLSAAGADRLVRRMGRAGRWMRWVEVVSGVLLIGVGILLFTNRFAQLNAYFIQLTPEWLLRWL